MSFFERSGSSSEFKVIKLAESSAFNATYTFTENCKFAVVSSYYNPANYGELTIYLNDEQVGRWAGGDGHPFITYDNTAKRKEIKYRFTHMNRYFFYNLSNKLVN